MDNGFWDSLPRPIIGLSPMDGVTDAVYRRFYAEQGKPDVIITEFVNVEGLARGAVSMLDHLIYDEIERPVVAQIYGVELDSFYKVALVCCELGFDGIDINMGCPATKVARRGSGAGMIKIPDHARDVVLTVKRAVADWAGGQTMEGAELRPKLIRAVTFRAPVAPVLRRLLPVSVKTRIGYDTVVTESWIGNLLETEPANISLHGRTLKQLYSGAADWEEIGKAARLCKNTGTSFLGNGDIKSLADAREKIARYDLDGVLIGRATFGNPWFFKDRSPTPAEAAKLAVHHSELFERVFPDRRFFIMRKHLGWMMRGFDGARELRTELMQAENAADVKRILSPLL